MALTRVWTTKLHLGQARIIVGDIVGLAPGNSLNVKVTHSEHPEYPVGQIKLLCGKRCQKALMSDDKVFDDATMMDVTPKAVPKRGS
jgi:hypothetical protein